MEKHVHSNLFGTLHWIGAADVDGRIIHDRSRASILDKKLWRYKVEFFSLGCGHILGFCEQ
jgi:hypothetical protein